MSSLKDVAQLAGVSITTVSRVINNPSIVDESTIAKVKDAIKKLDYRPNLLAKGLRAKNSKLIGLIVPQTSHYTFSTIAQCISDCCYKNGYSLIIGSHYDDPLIEENIVNDYLQRNIDGIILSLVSDASRILNTIQQNNVPTVLIDRVIPSNSCFNNSVSLDNYEAGRLAAKHLISLGHKRIACIMGPSSVWIVRERTRGFKDVLREHNLFLNDRLIAEGSFSFKTGIIAAKQIFSDLKKADYPTAIWAQSDLLASGAMHYLLSQGIKIPEDVALIGMDNIGLSEMLTPTLTTIAQPFQQIAEEAVRLVLSYHASGNTQTETHFPKGPSYIQLPPDLIIRQSTIGTGKDHK